MNVRDLLRRSAVGVAPDRTVRDAAQIMRSTGVGMLVVLDDDHLVGVVTDRDLVTRSLAAGTPDDARVDSVMTAPPVTIDAAADAHSCFGVFRTHGVRRLVVVEHDRVVGVVAVDDLLIDVAGDLADLVRPITAETIFGHHDAAVPATT